MKKKISLLGVKTTSVALLIVSTLTSSAALAGAQLTATNNKHSDATRVHHRSFKVKEGFEIAYREAGDSTKPTILLLHGFPTSSHMFRNLIPKLATKYHVLAPDYPGYGNSSQPDRKDFTYSFASFADLMEKFVDHKKVDQFAVYLMDYGAPVGYRLFAKNPDRVTGFIIQNGNAYDEGLLKFWDPIKKYWKANTQDNRNALKGLLTLGATKWQYTHGMEHVSRVSSDNWFHDQYLLDRKGNKDIQLDMFYDYRTNVKLYPKWQKLFRSSAPPTLIVWGKNDVIFPAAGAHPYKRDIKDIEVHILNSGHFVLEEKNPLVSALILDFLNRKVK